MKIVLLALGIVVTSLLWYVILYTIICIWRFKVNGEE